MGQDAKTLLLYVDIQYQNNLFYCQSHLAKAKLAEL